MSMPRRPKLEIPPVTTMRPALPAPRFRDFARSMLVILAAFVGICVALGIGLRIVRAVAF
ncbi:hypothetical protein LBMAG38_13910 [Chloroflexota bacterium]|nr:hypothetical protein LBMAG38_13910 [Chloroflexota bacterium]